MVSPSGRAVVLRSDRYEAEVVEVGAGLRSLRKDSADLVAGYAPDEMSSGGRGQVLLPWPNRIEDGSYEFDGDSYQLSLTEVARHNAIHGLVRWVTWRLVSSTEREASWAYRLHPQPGYPFLLDLTISYRLSGAGLRVDIAVENLGARRAPYGHGVHPYLTVGRRIDDCELTLPATSYSDVDDRGLPSAPRPVEGSAFDFRSPRLIGGTSFDNPFSVSSSGAAETAVVLRDPDTDRTATLTADAEYGWLQVFSGDTLSAEQARQSLAVEPMTCPPDAFRSGIDVIELAPGDTHSTGFTIS